jgi:hypothetical protein
LAGAIIEARMPVTVKLSQRFYEKFGHDLVGELVDWFNQMDTTYRSDLRELNDVNFARFDAKLEQRLSQFEAKLEQRLTESTAALRTEIRTGLADQRADLIKWMFVFWVGNFATTAGLMFALAHFLRS